MINPPLAKKLQRFQSVVGQGQFPHPGVEFSAFDMGHSKSMLPAEHQDYFQKCNDVERFQQPARGLLLQRMRATMNAAQKPEQQIESV